MLDQSFTYGWIGGSPGPVDGGPTTDFAEDVVNKLMDKALDALGGGFVRSAGCEAHKEACMMECGGDPDTSAQAINDCMMRKWPECQAKNASKMIKESIDKLNRR